MQGPTWGAEDVPVLNTERSGGRQGKHCILTSLSALDVSLITSPGAVFEIKPGFFSLQTNHPQGWNESVLDRLTLSASEYRLNLTKEGKSIAESTVPPPVLSCCIIEVELRVTLSKVNS